MKKVLINILFTFLTLSVQAQAVKKERRAVQVVPQQTFFINGGARATFDGKSRALFNFTLPPNTVEWYYSFSTTKEEGSNAAIGLLAQMTKLYDPTGITAFATNSILTPSGSGVCDIYLMDKKNADIFNDKVENWRTQYFYKGSGSRENFKNGTVQVKDILSGNWYLGFKNPSATEGFAVTFEIVAIVEETKTVEKTVNESKAEMFGNLGRKAYEKGEYDKCIELNKKAIELNPNLSEIHNTLGLAYLVKGDYISAIDSYSTSIALFKKSDNAKKMFADAIKDLNALINKHGQLDGASDILEMLKTNK